MKQKQFCIKKKSLISGFSEIEKNEWHFLFGILFMKVGLHFHAFYYQFVTKMIIPLIFADYFVKKWVIYYEVGKKNHNFGRKVSHLL